MSLIFAFVFLAFLGVIFEFFDLFSGILDSKNFLHMKSFEKNFKKFKKNCEELQIDVSFSKLHKKDVPCTLIIKSSSVSKNNELLSTNESTYHIIIEKSHFVLFCSSYDISKNRVFTTLDSLFLYLLPLIHNKTFERS